MSEQHEAIAGRYRLEAVIGRGASGVVWRARDERLRRTVAVKFLAAGDSPEAVELIVREGRVAARLRHPHAISVHDVVEHGGKPCLVMEYLPSRTLAELVDVSGPLPEELVAGVGWQVASALAAAHAAGIVHRDVTPFNILLGEDGAAKVVDFGIARAIGERTVTDARAVVGTPAFLAPEVAAGEEAVFASDVYSLGATLYLALEGHPPVGAGDDNPLILLRRASEGEVAPLRFPGPLGEVLLRVLRRDPARRPTMAEVRDLLDAVVEGRPLPGAEPASDETAMPVADERAESGEPRRGLWRRIALVAGVAVLVAGAAVVGTFLGGEEPAESAQPVPSTTTVEPTAVPAPSDCTAGLEITNSWPGGYQAQVTVRNTREHALTEWSVTWLQPAGHAISNLWNGNVVADAGSITVTNADYNARLPVDGSTTFGFTANGPATPRLDVSCTSGG